MSESKHTLGPWSISKIGNPYDQYAIYADSGENICNTVNGEANARLIAAAPELLAACEAMIQELIWRGTPPGFSRKEVNGPQLQGIAAVALVKGR